MKALAKTQTPNSTVIRETLTKTEAGVLIAGGAMHVHSSPQPQLDRFAKFTEAFLQKGRVPRFPWELVKGLSHLKLESSGDRERIIAKIIDSTGLSSKSILKGRVASVLEELLTNAIYHAYQSKDGKDKYARNKTALLAPSEAIQVSYGVKRGGVYLCVEDKGGIFSFEQVQNSLERCYLHRNLRQIESKTGGAGLGLYLVFEETSHLKITSTPGVSTKFECWIRDTSKNRSNVFSFNYFTKERK